MYRMNTPLIILASLSPLVAGHALADTFLGFYGTADYWNAELEGSFASTGNSNVITSLTDTLEEEQSSLSLRFEHGIPLIPNFYVRQNNLKFSNASGLSQDISLDGVSFSQTSPVNYAFDFSHTDLALYYELLDNWVSIDLGLGLKALTFDFELTQGGNIYRYDDDGTLPMIFGRAEFELPFTGWRINGTAMALSFESDSIEDVQVGVGYAPNDWVAFSAGWRFMEVDIEVPGLTESTLEIDGAYISATLHI